jgi:hypothetical protein
MNIDDTRMIAELHADVCVRVSSMASLVRRAGMVCVLAGTAFIALAPAHAQDRNGFRKDDLQQQQRDERSERNAQRQDTPRFDSRDLRVDDSRRQQDHSTERQRQSGRLTADERRDLRRQINEAGVDLYPNTPRR